jgi:NADH dehydrogenase
VDDILVVGGGFAGVWAAAAATRLAATNEATLSVHLVSQTDSMVIRPRLYEEDPDNISLALSRILAPIEVATSTARVTEVDADRGTARAVDSVGRERELRFRRLVLAAGSQLRAPGIPGADHLKNVDDLNGARALGIHLSNLGTGAGAFTAVVVGAGFTGIEVATTLVTRLRQRALEQGFLGTVRVILMDRNEAVGPDLGPGPRPVIEAALHELGIEIQLRRSITSVTDKGVETSDGAYIAARTVIWTAGIMASPLTQQIAGERDRLGRIRVDSHLRALAAPTVFVAGDTAAANADADHLVMPSCQHAIPLGKTAGHNVAADLLGLPLAPFAPAPYATCLDLGPMRAVRTTGWDRAVQLTGVAAKDYKQRTNEHLIYPPVDDGPRLLDMADYRVAVREEPAG